jgi:hypothetical protein
MGLKKILQAWLARATSSWGLEIVEIPLRNYGQDFRQVDRSPLTPSPTEEIGQNTLGNCVSYKCALALQLAPRWGISPVEIAEKLVSELNNSRTLNNLNNFNNFNNFNNLDNLNKQCLELPFLDVQPQIIDQGIINLRVSDRSLAQWLEQLRLHSSPDRENNPQNDPGVINHLLIQSAHARCCSLLRLAARENLIQLQDQPQAQLQHELLDPWQICLPLETPWLDDQGKFRLMIPQEQYLVNLLVNLVDEFDSDQDSAKDRKSIRKWLKLATEISLGFAHFDRYSQIFGETSLNNLPTAQARLGLIAITRWGLQELLVTYLGAIAPSEL